MPKPITVAKRDLTKLQFAKALDAEGFGRVAGGFLPYFFDMTGRTSPDIHYGAILNQRTWKIDRRATIASLIQKRRRKEARSR